MSLNPAAKGNLYGFSLRKIRRIYAKKRSFNRPPVRLRQPFYVPRPISECSKSGVWQRHCSLSHFFIPRWPSSAVMMKWRLNEYTPPLMPFVAIVGRLESRWSTFISPVLSTAPLPSFLPLPALSSFSLSLSLCSADRADSRHPSGYYGGPSWSRLRSLSEQIAMLEERLEDCKLVLSACRLECWFVCWTTHPLTHTKHAQTSKRWRMIVGWIDR